MATTGRHFWEKAQRYNDDAVEGMPSSIRLYSNMDIEPVLTIMDGASKASIGKVGKKSEDATF